MATSVGRRAANRRLKYFSWLALPLLAALLGGCLKVSPPEMRRHDAAALAAAAGWREIRLATGQFDLAGYVPEYLSPDPGGILTIYIEGDGLAWLTSSVVSPDPTPVNPVGLRLAFRHPEGRAAYLARPCQYLVGDEKRNCGERVWTSARFAPFVVAAMDQAVGQLKERFQARKLRLVGYSGGGAIAALIAGRRDDVVLLVTVAGNLDHRAWTDHHRLSPLDGSLNPADAWQSLAEVPQVHFVGEKDENITERLVRSFAGRFPADRRPEVVTIAGADHGCCWERLWPELYAEWLGQGN